MIWVCFVCVFVFVFFKFLTFAERLANVNINVIHRIDRTGSYAEVWNENVPLLITITTLIHSSVSYW